MYVWTLFEKRVANEDDGECKLCEEPLKPGDEIEVFTDGTALKKLHKNCPLFYPED